MCGRWDLPKDNVAVGRDDRRIPISSGQTCLKMSTSLSICNSSPESSRTYVKARLATNAYSENRDSTCAQDRHRLLPYRLLIRHFHTPLYQCRNHAQSHRRLAMVLSCRRHHDCFLLPAIICRHRLVAPRPMSAPRIACWTGRLIPAIG